MLLVRWFPKARVNLATIIDYVAERNTVVASKLQDDIERATSQLPQHPYLYRVGRIASTREIVVHHTVEKGILAISKSTVKSTIK